ncbi:IS701 family transposase [Streptomyces sp. NPDC049687]|uniref:IS701 family transposase n=1 Tax=Streptomyces sp. NPDC049687 TaxID=3365596 RepID=UPI0037AD3C4C
MSSSVVHELVGRGRAEAQEHILGEVCSKLFASLPRSDQRRRGVQYVRGLLAVEGRKSIRKIAALVGGPATEQSLHHFISSSTWDWVPVRRALARYLARTATAQAWVVRPIVIPKAGDHSVGVDRRFVPDLGQVLNAQRAVGVWAAAEELSFPVGWRLHLGRSWLDDAPRRRQAAIPDSAGAETLGDCAVEALLELAVDRELPRRPVIIDARELDAAALLWRLRATGNPFLVRVDGVLPLTPAEAPPAGHGNDLLPAHQLAGAVRELRRPVVWSDHAGRLRTHLVAATPVRPASRSRAVTPATGPDLLLLGAGPCGPQWPTEFWLTDLAPRQATFAPSRGPARSSELALPQALDFARAGGTPRTRLLDRQTSPARALAAVPLPSLFRLSRLIGQVDRDFGRITEQVGIRDFAGRSYNGWHRHVTLASAAHAVAALSGQTDVRARSAC